MRRDSGHRKSKIKNRKSPRNGSAALLPAARQIAQKIRQTLSADPPGHLRDGGIIREGSHAELDRLRALSNNSRTFLAEYQATLIARSGISSLKVGYNKVFGFYIEVTHAHAQKIPADFVRKQTVKSAERYITPELKQYEAEILTAQERALALEQELFEQLRARSLARWSPCNNSPPPSPRSMCWPVSPTSPGSAAYVRPVMTHEKILDIRDGRHPVVEQMLGEQFVPNDTALGQRAQSDAAEGAESANGRMGESAGGCGNQKSKIKNRKCSDH